MSDRGFSTKKACKIHLMGIGGAGMSALAQLLIEKGHVVSGCDMCCSSYLDKMLHQGVPISIGHDVEHLKGKDIDLLVYSSAISPNNPELLYAEKAGIPMAKRAEILSMLFNGNFGIGVAGAHGKTTTSSMTAFVLESAGVSPSVAIGGELCDIGGNAKLGQSDYMVAELDESDGSFELFECSIAIITNIDWDHVDHYPDINSVREGFHRFLANTKKGSTLVLCTADKGMQDFLMRYGVPEERNLVTYGWEEDCNWRASEVCHVPGGGVSFSVSSDGHTLGKIHLQLSGNHNVLNALAACSVALSLGIPFSIVSQALHDFRGAKRRLQKVGSRGNVIIYDDYGHHPREIAATLDALRNIFPGFMINVAFQPHRYSRTAAMYPEFAQALTKGDRIFLLPIYSADESNIWNASSRDIEKSMLEQGYPCTYCDDMGNAKKRILEALGDGNEVILTLGAGDVNLLGPILHKALEEKRVDEHVPPRVLAKTL